MEIFRSPVPSILVICSFLFVFECATISGKKDHVTSKDFSSVELEIETRIRELQKSGIHSVSYMYLPGDGRIQSGQIGGEGDNKIQRFKIGSITKLFTGIAILQLRDIGKLKLDDPVSKWLPEMNTMAVKDKTFREITLRDILTHQSGLPSDFAAGFFLSPKASDTEILSSFRNLPGRLVEMERNQPGKVHSYSNLAFGLLGSVIERVTHLSIEEYFQKEIFMKAGMKYTTLLELKEGTELVPSYQGLFWKTKTERPLIRDLTAGSISTTGADMGHFLKAFFLSKKGKGLLSKKSFDEFHQMQVSPSSNFELKIGLPVLLERWETSGKSIWFAKHSGSLPPYFADLMYDPETETASFLAGNTLGLATGKIQPTNKEILKLVYKQKTGDILDAPAIPTRIKQVEVADSFGIYVSPLGIHELTEGKKPKLELFGINFDLVPKDNLFAFELNIFFGLIPVRDQFLNSLRMEIENWEREKIFTVFSREMPKGTLGIAVQFQPDQKFPKKNYFGDYQTRDPHSIIPKIKLHQDKRGFTSVTITYALGGMENQLTLPCKLEATNQLRILGYGRNLGERIELGEKNGNPVVVYSGIEFEKI